MGRFFFWKWGSDLIIQWTCPKTYLNSPFGFKSRSDNDVVDDDFPAILITTLNLLDLVDCRLLIKKNPGEHFSLITSTS